ncbi:hypothetical protein [Domibacillus indicus]|uniref:hypothetical protein n=1 Tax=Domibacillus indicus TaxID=1437523 RepID=UPI000617E8AB|nr:hypothetical protein [Domibacillus indicus]
MTTFLITISFLIHAISLFALILLFQRQNKTNHLEKEMKRTAEEMEEMMSAFLMEIKEENEQLIADLSKTAPAKKAPSPLAAEYEEKEMPLPLPQYPARKAAVQAYAGTKHAGTKVKKPEDMPPAVRMADMKKQGMTDEEIAKALRIGITEVKLAFKFNKDE